MKRTLILVFAVLALLGGIHNTKAAAQGTLTYAYYCVVGDGTHAKSYFSGVFLGDLTRQGTYAQAFRNYVFANYSNVIGGVECFWPYYDSHSLSAARADRDGRAARVRNNNPPYEVVMTEWTY